MSELNISQQNLIDIYRTLYPTTAEYTYFPSAHGTYNKINRILGHQANRNKFKRTEIILRVSVVFFFDHW